MKDKILTINKYVILIKFILTKFYRGLKMTKLMVDTPKHNISRLKEKTENIKKMNSVSIRKIRSKRYNPYQG